MEVIIPSKFVKAEININKGDIVQLTTEGEYKPVEIKGEKKTVLSFMMKLASGEVKEYNMNVTTQKVLIKAWGKESKEWMNKNLKAWIEKQLSFGKKINVLVLAPEGAGDPFEEVAVEEEEIETVHAD
jgi:hypothetical protein